MNGFPISWQFEGNCIRCTSHALNVYGYPRLRRNNRQWPIARWILSRRLKHDLSIDIVVRHTCDNRWCINPAHIISGSHSDNMRDRDARGRQSRGERHYCAKLNPILVRVIRRLSATMSVRKIAKIFGMGRQPIRRVIIRERWKHV